MAVSRAEALESYRALPLPDTTQEHWRFTDLKDFDPDSFKSSPGAGGWPSTAIVESGSGSQASR